MSTYVFKPRALLTIFPKNESQLVSPSCCQEHLKKGKDSVFSFTVFHSHFSHMTQLQQIIECLIYIRFKFAYTYCD